jgi:hypothetical protein
MEFACSGGHLSMMQRLTTPVFSIMFLQGSPGYSYPGPIEKIHNLSEWSWLIYILSSLVVIFGVVLISTKGKHYGGWITRLWAPSFVLSLFLGGFLTIVGVVKIPEYDTISFYGGTTRAVHYVLYAPEMLPLGICMLVMASILIVVGAYRNTNAQKVARAANL